MAIYRIYPEKDTFVTSEPNLAGLYPNAGKDEIIEIGGFPDSSEPTVGRSSRALVQYSTSTINSIISDKISGPYSASLKHYVATATQLPTSFRIHAHPISSSWIEGTGKKDDNPINRTGTTWKYKDQAVTEWNTLGVDILNADTGSQLIGSTLNLDLDIDVTSAIDKINSGSLDNNGFLLKLEDSYENYTSSSINIKFFSKDTNTIYPPSLEFKWDDSVYSSNLDLLTSDISTITIKNSRAEYQDSGKVKFRLSARPKYPARTFVTSSIYTTEYKLPQESYWGIKDEFTEEMVVNFDTQYTKISADNTSSYFNVFMDTLQPERHYRLLIKTTLDGSEVVIDNKNIFKVVRNG